MYVSDLNHPNLTLEEKLQTLYKLNRGYKIDFGFRPPYLALLKAFGNPHKHLPQTIHIAGTNGKGSTLAFLRAFLEENDHSVHVMTSPHLVRFNERIVLGGKEIEDAELNDLIDEALILNKGAEITFFEITSAIAFAAFARTKADYLLLETGMGGRLDCTNIIEKPLLNIITPVSMDHEQYLGHTITEIAGEKAGIIKQNTPCVIAEQPYSQASIVFEKQAEKKKALLYRAGHEWDIKKKEGALFFKFNKQERTLPLPSLTGPHQISNAGTALAAYHLIKEKPAQEKLVKAIQKANWPGRLQKVSDDNSEWEIWLDGGHNKSAGEALSLQANIWNDQEKRRKPLYIVIGMMSIKDPKGFFENLTPKGTHIYIVPIEGEPVSFSPKKLTPYVNKTPYTVQNSLDSALSTIQKTQKPGRILITGSLYLVGEYLRKKGLL